MSRWKVAILAGAVLMLALLVWPGGAQAMTIERVSVAADGTQGNQVSGWPSISADGRYVAFASISDTLLPGDTNGAWDIFVYDRQTRTITRASVSSAEAEADSMSAYPSISADGRYVAFVSYASNLVDLDTNGVADIFVRDLVGGTTQRVSVATGGAQADADSDENPSISADGRYVAFPSYATNLVTGDTNGQSDIFVRDVTGATTSRVSVATGGAQAANASWLPSISGDGRYVAFQSDSADLVTGDANGVQDIFLHDRTSGTTSRVSVADDEAEAHGGSLVASISADGTHVAFESYAPNLVTPAGGPSGRDVYVRDLGAGTTVRASAAAGGAQPNGASMHASLSADGSHVAFYSNATDLVVGDTNGVADTFVRDLTEGTTSRVSVAANGAQADKDCWLPALSADGRFVAFASKATNLVPGDTNDSEDVFVVTDPGSVTYTTIRGSDRYDTALRISRAMFPAPLPAGSGVVLAPGLTFQQALCGAPLASAWGGPVLLNSTTLLYSTVRAELVRLAPARVFCIGLSNAVAAAVRVALPGATVTSIGGANVYAMSRNVANALAAKVGTGGKMTGATAIITIGTNFPDAIGVAPLACAELWPIILTDKAAGPTEPPLHASAIAALSDLGITKALRVGTYAKIPVGVTMVGSCSGVNRYATNVMVAGWAMANAGLTFTHTGIATGDKFPDALASGPYLAKDGGILLLSPLLGPLQPVTGALITANRASVQRVTFIAMVEPVIGQVKALVTPPST